MKSNRLRISLILLTLSIPFFLSSQTGNEDAGALLEKYIETGSQKYMEQIIESFPDSPYSLFCKAYEHIDANNQKARELAESLTMDYPAFAPGFIIRGIASQGLGMQEDFLADFEIGLQIDYKALASIFSSRVSQAIDNAIALAPDNIIYIYARGFANFANSHYRQALADFIKAIEMVPGSSDFYKYSGACQLYLDNGEGAQKDLNIALGSNPDDPEIYYYLGVLMNDILNQPSTAHEYMNNAIELDDQNPGYYYERARASYGMLNYQAAKDDINMALLKDQTIGDYYALRGQIKMKLDDSPDDFCQDFRQALDRGTSYNLKRIMKKACK